MCCEMFITMEGGAIQDAQLSVGVRLIVRGKALKHAEFVRGTPRVKDAAQMGAEGLGLDVARFDEVRLDGLDVMHKTALAPAMW